MRELEVHNITKWEPEAVADLIRSRGFKEELITADHPGFKETEEYFAKMKESIPEEEYAQVLKEMEELMGDSPADIERRKNEAEGNVNRTETFFDPEEQKRY
jgi:hypothetical protein